MTRENTVPSGQGREALGQYRKWRAGGVSDPAPFDVACRLCIFGIPYMVYVILFGMFGIFALIGLVGPPMLLIDALLLRPEMKKILQRYRTEGIRVVGTVLYRWTEYRTESSEHTSQNEVVLVEYSYGLQGTLAMDRYLTHFDLKSFELNTIEEDSSVSLIVLPEYPASGRTERQLEDLQEYTGNCTRNTVAGVSIVLAIIVYGVASVVPTGLGKGIFVLAIFFCHVGVGVYLYQNRHQSLDGFVNHCLKAGEYQKRTWQDEVPGYLFCTRFFREENA